MQSFSEETSQSGAARAAERQVVSLEAYARKEGDARIGTVRLNDISLGGCGFESDESFPAATSIWLKIKGVGAFPATVAWSVGQKHGCRFFRALEPEQLEAVHNAAG